MTAGQWEPFVERAARAGHDAFFTTEQHDDSGNLIPVPREMVWSTVARAVLATVGPLIAEDTRERMVAAAAAAIEREQPADAQDRTIRLLQDFIDPDECWYDHHGYCQAHGWFDTEPACPHARARKLLAEIGIGIEVEA